MGTRAQFFIGNPSNVDNRQWLGCVAWDGYPDGDCGKALVGVSSPEEFIAAVEGLAAKRDDFTDPMRHSFPFPWRNDLYLTDFTYAFFDGRVQVTPFHGGWRDLTADLIAGDIDPWGEDATDELPSDVLAPSEDGPKGPDSIMIIGVPKPA